MARSNKIGKDIKVMGCSIMSKAEKKHFRQMIIEGRKFSEALQSRRRNIQEFGVADPDAAPAEA